MNSLRFSLTGEALKAKRTAAEITYEKCSLLFAVTVSPLQNVEHGKLNLKLAPLAWPCLKWPVGRKANVRENRFICSYSGIEPNKR